MVALYSSKIGRSLCLPANIERKVLFAGSFPAHDRIENRSRKEEVLTLNTGYKTRPYTYFTIDMAFNHKSIFLFDIIPMWMMSKENIIII